MLITISGPPGSGKSTLSRMVSLRLGLEVISIGDIFRKMAENRCMSVEEFGLVAKCDENIDRKLDEEQKKIAKEKDNLILEGRLSGFLVDDADLKVWLKAPLETRGERIAKRESKSVLAAMRETSEREKCESDRYLGFYDININDLSVYDLIIESSKWKPDQICEIVVKAVDCLK